MEKCGEVNQKLKTSVLYIYQLLTQAMHENSYMNDFEEKKKSSFFSCSSKQKCMKLKKKNDIERNSTKFYYLGRIKQYCFIYQFFLG